MALITPYVDFTGLYIYFYYHCFIFFFHCFWFPLLIFLKHGWFLGRLGCWNPTQRVNSGIPFLLKHYLFTHTLCSTIFLTSKVEMCSQTHFCSDNLISATLKPLFGNVSLAWFCTFNFLIRYTRCTLSLNLQISKLGKLIDCRISTSIR